jgi:hypothetical protein
MKTLEILKKFIGFRKIIILLMLALSCNSCFVLKSSIYNSYNAHLYEQVAHFNVYDVNDSLINTSIYRNNVVVLTFIIFGIFKKEDFKDFNKYYNKIVDRFSKFSDIKFVNIAVELNRDQWLKILENNVIKGDNYLCKDSQNTIYDFYDNRVYDLNLIYNKEEKIMGYNLFAGDLTNGPFYALRNISVVTGNKMINKRKSKWDSYTKYVANECEKAINDSTYIFNPTYYDVK